MRESVELIIPGLFKLPLYEFDKTFLERDLASLNCILRYAIRVENKQFELDSLLKQSLGLSEGQGLPLAQAFVEKSISIDGDYLLCKAIHLKLDMRNAIVLPLDNSQDTENDISIIINDLNELFNPECNIKSISDKYWLMHLKQCKVPDIYPHYLSVIGRKANQYMQQSKQILPWYQLINEMQMFMHAHEVNQGRLLKGLLPINSLWCWGGGPLPEPRTKNIHWYTNDELLRRFADKLGILNSDIEHIADDHDGHHKVCIELSILETLKSVRDDNLKLLLSHLEQQLFKPLVRLVKSRRSILRLRAGYEFDFALTPISLYQFWRKTKNLHHFPDE